MTTSRFVLPLVTLTLVVAGCEVTGYRDSQTPVPGYGNATSQNAAVMIVDPHPAGAANTDIDFDGRAAWLASERYREGKVIPPVQLKTSDIETGGSGGGTGGAAVSMGQ